MNGCNLRHSPFSEWWRGQNLTLPPMVTDLAAKGSNATITVSWTNPESDALSGVAVVYNSTHTPDKPSDGTKVDAGLSETASLTDLENGTLYYIRVFPYNAKKQYQTLLNGATTSATPNIGPAQVTNFQVTGSGSSPVLTWVNPADDPLYYQTVVVQKTGSAPTSLTDGTEIYRGTGTTVTASNLVRLEEYYWAVFTVDEGGSYRTPVVSEMYSYDFPDEPTSYSDLIMVGSTQTWTAPEDGYFRFIVCGRGGDGGGYPNNNGSIYGGGGGGAGGIAVSVFALNKGETVSCICSIVQTQINYNGNVATANPGEDGEDGRMTTQNLTGQGGAGGSASGGNVINKRGGRGEDGLRWTINGDSPTYNTEGGGGTNSYDGKTIYGGQGEGHGGSSASNDYPIAATAGTTARIYIQRGNTNIAAPSAASTLSLTPRNASIEANWENSQDPESVGNTLVVNSEHAPTSIEDGTAIDVAAATSYTINELPNDKPSYVSLFSYNADKTKYSTAKSDVEIPREVTWYDVQEDLKEDIADAQEDAEQAQEVVLLTRDFLPDAVALTLPEIYDEWNPDSISYIGKDTATEDKPASIVRYNNALYCCLQSHTSQASWTPEASPSLWVLIDDPAIEWPEWKQPTGAHDAYDLNAKVSYNGKKWISQIAANTVEPGTDERYWKEYTE